MRFYCFTSGNRGASVPKGFTEAPCIYRLDQNGRLYRREGCFSRSDSLMALDAAACLANTDIAAERAVRECVSRGFSGIVLLPGASSALLAETLANRATQARLSLFVPEALFTHGAKALIPSGVLQGSFSEKLSVAAARYGAENTALLISPVCVRIKPSRDGWCAEKADIGEAQAHLSDAERDKRLLLRYYAQDGAFLLFDDTDCVAEKIRTAKALGIHSVFIRYADLAPSSGLKLI